MILSKTEWIRWRELRNKTNLTSAENAELVKLNAKNCSGVTVYGQLAYPKQYETNSSDKTN
jgi:hypothetical protein